MERMTPLDAWFLAVEDGIDHMHMALVMVLEGPCPSVREVHDDLRARLDRVPRYRQRVRTTPFGLGSPSWEDDPDFDIAHHVHRRGLPRPRDQHALELMVGEIVSEELDRRHPLWGVWVVERLDDDRWAMVTKVHHCLTDGVGGQELISALFDLSPDAPAPPPSGWSPAQPAGRGALVADALGQRLRPGQFARSVLSMAKEPQRLARRVRDMQRGLGTLARDLPPTPPTVLNGPLGPGRSWWGASVPMARVAEIRERHAVTVNDVALAAIAGGLRDLLSAHGESLEGREVRSLVPVSLRTGTDGALHNHVAAMVADLPVLVEDPVERLHEVHRRLVALKSSHEAEVTATAVDAAKHLPWLAVATGFGMATRYLHTFVQRNINTVTTNVPGPDVPLYWMRRRILESWPVTPIGESVRVGVAIHSYAGAMTFGVTTDRASVPDGAVLARGIEREVMAMADAASLPPQAAPVTVP